MLVPRPAGAASFLRAVNIQISQEHKPKYSIHAPRRRKAFTCALAFAAIEHRVCPARAAYGACPCFHFTVWFVYYIIFFFPCQSPCRYTYINIWKTAADRTEKRLSPYKL